MKAIQTKAIINTFRSKVDRSLSFSVNTPELSTEERAMFMDLQGINVDMLIQPLDNKYDGLEKIDKEMNTKTQSQRLRSILFLYWKQLGEEGKFDDFYRTETEKVIEFYKGKLDQ